VCVTMCSRCQGLCSISLAVSLMSLAVSFCLSAYLHWQARVTLFRNVKDEDLNPEGLDMMITIMVERINMADLEDEMEEEEDA